LPTIASTSYSRSGSPVGAWFARGLRGLVLPTPSALALAGGGALLTRGDLTGAGDSPLLVESARCGDVCFCRWARAPKSEMRSSSPTTARESKQRESLAVQRRYNLLAQLTVALVEPSQRPVLELDLEETARAWALRAASSNTKHPRQRRGRVDKPQARATQVAAGRFTSAACIATTRAHLFLTARAPAASAAILAAARETRPFQHGGSGCCGCCCGCRCCGGWRKGAGGGSAEPRKQPGANVGREGAGSLCCRALPRGA
jgi:hypothetical protein